MKVFVFHPEALSVGGDGPLQGLRAGRGMCAGYGGSGVSPLDVTPLRFATTLQLGQDLHHGAVSAAYA
jgi:hypothetical protein